MPENKTLATLDIGIKLPISLQNAKKRAFFKHRMECRSVGDTPSLRELMA